MQKETFQGKLYNHITFRIYGLFGDEFYPAKYISCGRKCSPLPALTLASSESTYSLA